MGEKKHFSHAFPPQNCKLLSHNPLTTSLVVASSRTSLTVYSTRCRYSSSWKSIVIFSRITLPHSPAKHCHILPQNIATFFRETLPHSSVKHCYIIPQYIIASPTVPQMLSHNGTERHFRSKTTAGSTFTPCTSRPTTASTSTSTPRWCRRAACWRT